MDIHVREIGSRCYGMIDDRIFQLAICGFEFDCKNGEYINKEKNEVMRSLGDINETPLITYYVRKMTGTDLFRKLGCNLFDSKEELIKYLLDHES